MVGLFRIALNYALASPYRPLAVYVNWSLRNGKLVSELVFDTPLEQGRNYAYASLERAMRMLGVESTMDLNSSNVYDTDTVWNG